MDIIERLRELKPALLRDKKIKTLRLFGSYATGQATETSDVDILLSFYETPDLFQLGGIHTRISEALGKDVDISIEEYLLPEFKDRIFGEAIDI